MGRDPLDAQVKDAAAWLPEGSIANAGATFAFYFVSMLVLALMIICALFAVRVAGGSGHAVSSTAPGSEMDSRSHQFEELAKLSAELTQAIGRRNALAREMDTLDKEKHVLTEQVAAAQTATPQPGAAIPDKVDALIAQLSEINQRIGILNTALADEEAKIGHVNGSIQEYGSKLNVALVDKVEDLEKYKSEFFGKMREAVEDNSSLKINGDRFVFPSEVLFDSGSDVVNEHGLDQIRRVASVVRDMERRIPKDLKWVLRIDGHTDRTPITGGRFKSNWELSTLRATSVVHTMVAAGVAPEHLAAAGFGEFQPVDPGNSPAALAKNRRIEIMLDGR